jgi:hypothetical protein
MSMVNGVGGGQQKYGVHPNAFQSQIASTLGPVAQLFGESTSQLEGELQTSGTSLSSLAQQKGVSQSDLVSAIQQGLQSAASANGQALSSTQIANIANRIANHVHGGHHHHRSQSNDSTSTASVDPTTLGPFGLTIG